MLQVGFIRQNAGFVKQRLGIRNFKHPELVDEIIALDDEVKRLKKKTEDAQMQINSRSDQIQKLIRNNQKEETASIRDEVALLKTVLAKERPELEQKNKSLEEKLL